MVVKIEHVMFFVIAGIFCSLIFFAYLFARPQIAIMNSSEKNTPVTKVDPTTDSVGDRLTKVENDVSLVSSSVADLKTRLNNQSSINTTNGKTVYTVVASQGGDWTTTSQDYSPLGIFVNAKCPASCNLWINFYSSSKNSGVGVVGTFDIFIDGGDRNIFSQALYQTAGMSIPVGINGVVSLPTGVHTVEIKAKTTGGTLESTTSFLQVMAVEQ